MSNYGDPGPAHRNALSAVNEARQRALTAVSKMQQAGPPPHHPYLAPAGDDPELATIATQAVTDYLMQLRPYRASSSVWNVSFGELELPERLSGSSAPAMGFGKGADLIICRPPTVHIGNVSEFVDVANMTVNYSTKPQGVSEHDSVEKSLTADDKRVLGGRYGGSNYVANKTKEVKITINTEEYGDLTFDDASTAQAVLDGALSPSEAVEFAATADEEELEDDEDDDLVLGDPSVESHPGDTPGIDHRVESYNLVFPPAELKQFAQLGDDIAEELGVLGDLEAPDHTARGGGAV